MDSSFNNMAAESVQAKVTSGGGRDAADVAPGAQQSPGLFQQIMEHSKATWKHVGQGKASAAEYLEAGIEIVAVSVAARYGLNRLGSTVDGSLLQGAETGALAVPKEQTLAAGEKFLRPTIVSSGELRDRAVDRLAPGLSRRTLRYTIDEKFPREQF